MALRRTTFICPRDGFNRPVWGELFRDSIGRWGLATYTRESNELRVCATNYIGVPDEVTGLAVAKLLNWHRDAGFCTCQRISLDARDCPQHGEAVRASSDRDNAKHAASHAERGSGRA